MDENGTASTEKYIKALKDISQAVTSDIFLEDLLKLIVILTAKVMSVEICSLWLVDDFETPSKIHLKATQAIDPEYVKDRTLRFDEGVVGYVVSAREPLIIENVLENPRFKEKEMARRLGLVSMLGVPLWFKGEKVIGAVNCFTSKFYDFSETEVNVLSAVANQAAVAILNGELMVRTKVIQEELENRKMIEKAKEVLMHRRKITGAEAHRWIQKQSMDSRKSLRQIAEAVLLSEEIDAK